MAPRKAKSRRQVRFLLSEGTPLSGAEKARLRRELKSGKVRVRKGKR